MKNTKLARFASALVLTLSSLLTLSVPLAHAVAYTCVWTGATDLKFSTTTNWTGCNGVAPQPGDTIAFGQASNSTTINLTNDLGSVALGGVISQTTTSYSHYVINTISLAAGATLGAATSNICNTHVANIDYGTLNAAGALTANTDASSLFYSNLSVNGNLTIENTTGTGYLFASPGSTVTGQVIVASPYAYNTATGCGGAGGGGLQSGSSFTGFTLHGLTVQNGANTNLADTSFPLTLGGGTGTTSPLVYFYGNIDANSNYVATTYTVSGPITMTHDALFSAQDKATVNVTGSISGAAFTLTNDTAATGILNLNPSSNASKSTTGSQVNATKTVTVANDQSTTSFIVVPNETLVVDGKAGYVNLLTGSTLMGNGQVAGLFADTGSIVAPGHSPGCITSANGITIHGTYQEQVGGTDPCTGYDQLKVIGGVNLDGVGILEVTPYNGFVPKVGQSYTIIDNDLVDAVTGTFAGIAEGGAYTNQGVTYSVTYKGGDGNDVVLTVTKVDASALPAKPNTGLLLVAAHPMISLGASVIAAGLLYGASRRVKTVRR